MAKVITYDIYSVMTLTASYSDYQRLSPIFEKLSFRVSDTAYSDSVTVTGKIVRDKRDELIKGVTEATSDRVKIEILEEIFDF